MQDIFDHQGLIGCNALLAAGDVRQRRTRTDDELHLQGGNSLGAGIVPHTLQGPQSELIRFPLRRDPLLLQTPALVLVSKLYRRPNSIALCGNAALWHTCGARTFVARRTSAHNSRSSCV